MLEKIINNLEKRKKAGEKVDTKKIIEYCKNNKIPPPQMFKEAAKKSLLGVFR